MVEINNQRKAFLDMLAWSEGTDNGRQKTRNHGYDVIVGGELFIYYPITLATTKPKTQINRRRTLPASFPLVGCSPQAAWPERLLSGKVRTLWHCSRLRSVALYLWLIVVISVRHRTAAAISGLHCRALVISSEHKADSLIAKSRSGRNGQRDWCMSRVIMTLPLWLSASSSGSSWAVNHYRDNAITYKAQRDKMPENWSWRTRQLLTCRCVSVMLLRSMQNTRRS